MTLIGTTLSQRSVIVAGLLSLTAGLAGCGGGTSQSASASSSNTLTFVSQIMNWYAEPEMGGQYNAQIKGYYKNLGLSMTTHQGSPQESPVELVASGKDTFGMAGADSILLARQQGIPVVALFAVFQTDPQILIWHKGSGIHGFHDLSGHPVYVSAGSDYWTYITKKYHLTNIQQRAYNGTLTSFIHDPRAVIQGYIMSEPFTLKQSHVSVNYELTANSGFNPYQNVMFTTETEIKNHPKVVAAFVKASLKGWHNYFQNPKPANSFMKTKNPTQTPASMIYAVNNEKSLILGGAARQYGLGYMSTKRWQLLDQQMIHLGMLKPGFSEKGAFTNSFLP